ncbi:MAG: 50S ribosomal protein L22 [Candidatus Paceibacterota bacterium]
MKAKLSQFRQSPRKVRLVTDAVKGKSVNDALRKLRFLTKRASSPIAKLIESAVANAEENEGKRRDDLTIASITVDQGPTLRRYRPRARGRATRINKRTSHISVSLTERNGDNSKS